MLTLFGTFYTVMALQGSGPGRAWCSSKAEPLPSPPLSSPHTLRGTRLPRCKPQTLGNDSSCPKLVGGAGFGLYLPLWPQLAIAGNALNASGHCKGHFSKTQPSNPQSRGAKSNTFSLQPGCCLAKWIMDGEGSVNSWRSEPLSVSIVPQPWVSGTHLPLFLIHVLGPLPCSLSVPDSSFDDLKVSF